MIYVFDTSAFIDLNNYYPGVFKSVWVGLNCLVANKELISTREVWNELDRMTISRPAHQWAKANKQIFTTPTAVELEFVATIFQEPHFHTLIGKRQQLTGMPVADPFVIACAKIKKGTVVTQEQSKPNAGKIPNVCEYFRVPCINLEKFMSQQGWSF